MKTRQQPSQRGFTLIELMISMAIGLLVAIAAVQLFVTALSSFNLQRGLSDVNENGRFGLDYIVRNVRVGQYSKSSLASDPTDSAVVMTAAQLPGSPAGGFSTNTDSGTLGITSGDQLVVRRWVPASTTNERDCEGNIINAGADGVYAVSRYFLKADGTNSASALVMQVLMRQLRFRYRWCGDCVVVGSGQLSGVVWGFGGSGLYGSR